MVEDPDNGTQWETMIHRLSEWKDLNEDREIPEWIIKYDKQDYQSSAGKAVRELIEIIRANKNKP